MVAFAACGAAKVQGQAAVVISPKKSGVVTNATLQFAATVTGLADTSVAWTIDEGAAGGAISQTGLYTAPSTAGFVHVTATSKANASIADKAVLTISGPASGTPGVWQNVTPTGINLNNAAYGSNDNYGVQDVLADPARPSDLYVFICYQGVWKSTDYGLTWNKVSAPNSPVDKGKNWGEAIDPNPNRNPSLPPALYSPVGNAPERGLFKSTDGGITWTQTWTDPGGYGVDIYSVDVDPNDSQHLLVSFHDNNMVAESVDGGQHWTGRGAVAGVTLSPYVFFVSSTVWLLVSQWTDANGTHRTEDSGNTWTKVSANEHFHGNSQIYVGAGGVVYLPGAHGIERSSDSGKTWSNVFSSSQNSIVATASFLYSSDAWATSGTWNPNPRRSPANSGANGTWAANGTPPSTMTNGAKRQAVTFDGSHYVIVSGNWLSGLWRYVEQ